LNTHRAILGQVAHRLQLARDPGDIMRFLSEFLLPLGNTELERTTEALARAAVKLLLNFHADAETLFRAMGKMQMAGAMSPAKNLAGFLNFWRVRGVKVRRARQQLWASVLLFAGGAVLLGYAVFALGAFAGKNPVVAIAGYKVPWLWIGGDLIGVAGLIGLLALFNRSLNTPMPSGRSPLTTAELAFLRGSTVKRELRAILGPRKAR